MLLSIAQVSPSVYHRYVTEYNTGMLLSIVQVSPSVYYRYAAEYSTCILSDAKKQFFFFASLNFFKQIYQFVKINIMMY